MKKSDEPIVVEQRFDAPVEEVWKAITELDRMRQWYFEQVGSFKLEVGFETIFDVEVGERSYSHIWTITEVDAPHKIAYRWRYDGYEGDSAVSFEISEDDGGSKLRLTHRTIEDFQIDIPEFTRESGLAGWTYFIQESLKSYLDSKD